MPDEGTFLAVIDGPDESSLQALVESTAAALGISVNDVALLALRRARDRWPFEGEPAAEDPTRRNPRPTRWERIDVGPDDQTLRILFVHGIPDGLHHVDVYEDDEEFRVTVYLGLNHDWTGRGHVWIGISAWTSATTKGLVGHRYINDGADIL